MDILLSHRIPGRVLCLGILLGSLSCVEEREAVPGSNEAVMLIHGLERTEASLAVLQVRLARAGFDVHTVDYPSGDAPMEDHVETLATAVADCCIEADQLHFVSHSLGGLVVRSYLGRAEETELSLPPGRAVMLAPPNQGSQVADALVETELGTWYLGPTGSLLGTHPTNLPATLPIPTREVGIIAGSRSLNPIGSLLIPGPDDGAVGIKEVQLPGAKLIVVPRTHTFIMNSRWVADATIRFLLTGSFEPINPGR